MLQKIFKYTISVIVLIAGIPIIILLFIWNNNPVSYFQRKSKENKFAKFLVEHNGKNFFCYNNREDVKKYIEDKIIPKLNDEIEIIYLNGKKVESEYDEYFIAKALYSLKHYNRFPHLIKIRDNKLIDKSINNYFYNTMNLNTSENNFLLEVNSFFELG